MHILNKRIERGHNPPIRLAKFCQKFFFDHIQICYPPPPFPLTPSGPNAGKKTVIRSCKPPINFNL